MKFDYKKLLEYYCGKNIFNLISGWKDDSFKVNGEWKDLVLNNWIIEPNEKFKQKLTFEEIMTILVDSFDIIYSYTDKQNKGKIIDFEFNEAFIYYDDVDASLYSIKKIAKSLEKEMSDKINFRSSLHFANVILGNWGARKRFKYTILGNDVDYCRKLSLIDFKKDNFCVTSSEFKNLVNIESDFKEIKEYNTIFYDEFDKGKIFEYVL